MTLRITVLGCGSSGGVPRIGNNWGECDPDNPRNRRRRCSLLVQKISAGGTTNVLVDTSPDMREQLLSTEVGWLDGVLYTHDHADHIHGIDDLRVIAINGGKRINVWADASTLEGIKQRFGYCFEQPYGSDYPPICVSNIIVPGTPLTINGPGGPVTAQPFEQIHGNIKSLGFRFGSLAYSSDLNDLPSDSFATLKNLDVWIVDALRRTPHPSHFNLEQALDWIERIKPVNAVLTNMHVDLDYDTLVAALPVNVQPAYDGMQFTFPD